MAASSMEHHALCVYFNFISKSQKMSDQKVFSKEEKNDNKIDSTLILTKNPENFANSGPRTSVLHSPQTLLTENYTFQSPS